MTNTLICAAIWASEAVVVAALGDATVSALVAGVFLILNTITQAIIWYVLRRPGKKERTAQRTNRIHTRAASKDTGNGEHNHGTSSDGSPNFDLDDSTP